MKNVLCKCGECGERVSLVDYRVSEGEIIGQCERCDATNAVDAPGEPKTRRVAKNAAERSAHLNRGGL